MTTNDPVSDDRRDLVRRVAWRCERIALESRGYLDRQTPTVVYLPADSVHWPPPALLFLLPVASSAPEREERTDG